LSGKTRCRCPEGVGLDGEGAHAGERRPPQRVEVGPGGGSARFDAWKSSGRNFGSDFHDPGAGRRNFGRDFHDPGAGRRNFGSDFDGSGAGRRDFGRDFDGSGERRRNFGGDLDGSEKGGPARGKGWTAARRAARKFGRCCADVRLPLPREIDHLPRPVDSVVVSDIDLNQARGRSQSEAPVLFNARSPSGACAPASAACPARAAHSGRRRRQSRSAPPQRSASPAACGRFASAT
jgi:hypothetical protein